MRSEARGAGSTPGALTTRQPQQQWLIMNYLTHQKEKLEWELIFISLDFNQASPALYSRLILMRLSS